MFTHKFRYLFALLLSLYTYANTEFCRLYHYFNIRIEWYYALLTIVATTFLVLEMNSQLEKLLKKRFGKNISVARFKAYFFILASILSSVLTTLIVLIMGMVIHSYPLEQNIVPLKLNLIYCWLVNLLFHLINAIIFYIKEYNATKLEAQELKTITAQAELQLIKSQINPHFLFNNLNVLSALVLKKNEDANKFIEEFSKVYRYILVNHDKELVELKTELQFIKPYIFLLEKRFSEGLIIRIDIGEQQMHKFIIPASLQMLIENAIKHNVVSKNRPLTIRICAGPLNEIVVSNNLQMKQTIEHSTGIGLSNISKRYRLVSNASLKVERTEEVFSVSLPLVSMN